MESENSAGRKKRPACIALFHLSAATRNMTTKSFHRMGIDTKFSLKQGDITNRKTKAELA